MSLPASLVSSFNWRPIDWRPCSAHVAGGVCATCAPWMWNPGPGWTEVSTAYRHLDLVVELVGATRLYYESGRSRMTDKQFDFALSLLPRNHWLRSFVGWDDEEASRLIEQDRERLRMADAACIAYLNSTYGERT